MASKSSDSIMTQTRIIWQRLLTSVMAFCLAVSCVREQTEPSVFTAIPSILEVTADRQKQVIELTSDFPWDASMRDGSWCRISKEVSTDPGVPGKIIADMEFNTGDALRSDTILVSSGTQVLRIPVVQNGVGSVISPRELILKDRTEATFTVSSMEPWKSTVISGKEGDVSWLSLSPVSAQDGLTVVTVSADDSNLNVGERSAVIRISLQGVEVDVKVLQPQTDVILASADTVRLDCEGEVFTVGLNRNVDYEIVLPSTDWLSHIQTRGLLESKESFEAKANLSGVGRDAVIVFRSSTVSDTLHVIQPSYPDDPFLASTRYGIYGLGGRDWTADPMVSQLGLRMRQDSYSFHILYPESSSVVEVTGIGYGLRPGQVTEVHVSLLSDGLVMSRDYKVTVLRKNSQAVWLRSDGGHHFILKNPEGI